jgi:hypothetical protein
LNVSRWPWYDVCLGYNAGTPDGWFDTSNRATTYSKCANKPSATLDIRSDVSGRFRGVASSAVGLVYESTYGWFDLDIIN